MKPTAGTIFLDEISNTSLDFQASLLRVLQEGEVRRVGENKAHRVDVRLLAAANVDLRRAVEDGTFREDLFYRLNVVMIRIPALRERPEDIPLLVDYFLERACKKHERATEGFATEAMRLIIERPWPGNVRELEHFVERAVILSDHTVLDTESVQALLPQSGSRGVTTDEIGAPRAESLSSLASDLSDETLTLADFDARCRDAERRYLENLVTSAGGNLSEASRRAGVKNRNSLVSRLKKHGIFRDRETRKRRGVN